VINKAKYDAWAALGSLSKHDAMQRYVDGFVDTIKTLQKNATPEEVREALSYAKPQYIAAFKPLVEGMPIPDNMPEDAVRMIRELEKQSEEMEAKPYADTDGEEEFSDTMEEIPGQGAEGGRLDNLRVLERVESSLAEISKKLDSLERRVKLSSRRRFKETAILITLIACPFAIQLIVESIRRKNRQ